MMGDLFSDFAECFAAPVEPEEKDRCGAKDRNAKCVRAAGHPGWHRSITGCGWPDRGSAKEGT